MRVTKKYIEIEKTLKKIERIDKINHGGCGVVALCAAKKYNLKVKALYENSEMAVACYQQNIRGRPKSATHIVFVYQNKLWDAKGIVPQQELAKYKHSHVITKKYLRKMLEHGKWNENFNRSNVKIIEAYFGVQLNLINF